MSNPCLPRQREPKVQYHRYRRSSSNSITALLDRSFLSDSVEVRLSPGSDLWPVEVDPHELETAIVNLAVNVRDAMPRGGAISIEARNVRVRKAPCRISTSPASSCRSIDFRQGRGHRSQRPRTRCRAGLHHQGSDTGLGPRLEPGARVRRADRRHLDVSSTAGVGMVALYLPRAESRRGSEPGRSRRSPDEEEEEAPPPKSSWSTTRSKSRWRSRARSRNPGMRPASPSAPTRPSPPSARGGRTYF